jgi:S-adenosylmethionine decarboxylase
MMDCYGCNPAKLDDLNVVFRFLNELPDKMGMHKITAPYAFHYDNPETGDAGITGVVIIAESHISIHTFPKKGYMTMDAYSCKDFDPKIAIGFVRELFSPTHIQKRFLYRGKQQMPVSIAALK